MKKKKKFHAYMINDLINFNIDELVSFIEDEYPSADIYNVKRTYFHLQPNGNDLNKILISFLVNKINETTEGGEEATDCVLENLDIFFDITNKTEDVYIVERMENN